MCEKRFFQLDFDEVYYIFDNEQIPKGQVIDNEFFDDFDLSLNGTEVVDKLNEMDEKIHDLEQDLEDSYDANGTLEAEIIKLRKENEQLKRDLEEAIETFEPKLLKLNSDLIHELGVSKSLRDVVKEQDKEIKRLKRNVKRFKDDRDSNFETMKYWKNKALKESEDE